MKSSRNEANKNIEIITVEMDDEKEIVKNKKKKSQWNH